MLKTCLVGAVLVSLALACSNNDKPGGDKASAVSSGGNGSGTLANTANATDAANGSATTNGPTGNAGGAPGLAPIPGADDFNCSSAEGAAPALTLTEVASGFDDPLFVTYAPGDASRLFVVEQVGRIFVLVDGEPESDAFLDISDNVQREGNEQGLLGLAFHPDYAENGRFFVNYSAAPGAHGAGSGDTIISEFSVSAAANLADASSERVLLTVPQPYGNHNGGMLAFGPDGFMYIGLGDGGDGGDPDGNGQDPMTLLGSILRIDVDASDAGEYGIPVGNMPNAAPEVWDFGLRNPWRFSFDGCTGDLYIGDVGQDSWEEINVVPRGQGHNNFGWRVREGAHCFRANSCDNSGMIEPVAEYGRGTGVSITGGYVYRGSLVPGLRGTYFYADYDSGAFFAFEYDGGAITNQREISSELGTNNGQITSLGQDAEGEVYVVRRYGAIERIEAAP
jgi:glucose/arabinose dehydrogenase